MSVPIHTDIRGKNSLGALIPELFSTVAELVQAHVQLTKTEIKVESQKFGLTMVLAVSALTMGLFFLLFLGVSLVFVFKLLMDWHWATLSVTGIFLVCSLILAALSLHAFRKNTDTVQVP